MTFTLGVFNVAVVAQKHTAWPQIVLSAPELEPADGILAARLPARLMPVDGGNCARRGH
jgi:hypothetical protein